MMLPATLEFGPREEELRREIREWLAAADSEPMSTDYMTRSHQLIEWQRRLFEAGFLGLSWPEEYGGKGMDISADAVLAEELALAGMPEIINRLALFTWAPPVLIFGTEEQKSRWLPAMLDASEIWCQGFSEPQAGSDLAAVRTKAVVDGDELVITGQKTWTSRAPLAKWNGMLVRTDPAEKRHRGLTVVVIDMESPGIELQPLLQITHQPDFSEVFFDDVRVPIENVLGEIGEGWKVAMKTMSFERGLYVLERQIRHRRELDRLALQIGDGSEPAISRLGSLYALFEVLEAQVYRSLSSQASGTQQPGDTSVDRLMLSEAEQSLYATAYDLLGPEIANGEGDWAEPFLDSRGVSIYSGTSQIQRNIIADRLLRLPRST
jgi:alkylation response protein AidB-like acyl-CoA dehydrogenase